MGQGFPSSPDLLPLSFVVRYASRLSVAGSWHQHRNKRVTDSIHRNPVREGETYNEVIILLDKQIVDVDHGDLLPFRSTWNQFSISVDPCNVDCLSAATVVID